MALPSKTALAVYRGDRVALDLRLWLDADKTEPADLTDAEVRAEIRATTETTLVMSEFDVEVAGNTITLTLLPKKCAELAPACVFDVEVMWDPPVGDDVQTVLQGTIAVSPDVTRPAVV